MTKDGKTHEADSKMKKEHLTAVRVVSNTGKN
jgi:hypothetical protein